MKTGLLIALLFCSFSFTSPDDVWDVLGELKFKVYFDQQLEEIIFEPLPDAPIKKLVGQRITLDGFESSAILPIPRKLKENAVFLSRHLPPSSLCYSDFGYETCIEVWPKKPLHLTPNHKYRFKGTFELNTTDFNRLPFILKGAECLNCPQ